MSNPEDRIKLRIDIKSGTIELDAAPADFEHAVQKTKELAESIQFGEKVAAAVQPVEAAAVASTTASLLAAGKREKNRNGATKSSVGRPGRIGSFEPIRDLLTEEQHQALHAFMKEKAPVDQEDQVLVAVHKGEQLLKRQGLNYNEIYTLLWRAGVDPMPKAIDVVIQRLMQDQKMDKGDSGFFMKFIGQSRVEKDLPLTSKD